MADQNENLNDPNHKSSEDSDDDIVDEVDPYPLPSNQDYLSYYVYQNEWRPTRPIRPIGAMFANPGPGAVYLPPTTGEKGHDLTKTKAPAYKMGIKHRHGGADQNLGSGPGPGMYNTQGLTNMGRDRNKGPVIGKSPRFKERDKGAHQYPGPASFNTEAGNRALFQRGPAFSMPRAKRGEAGPFGGGLTPAPNAYTMPTAIGPGSNPVNKAPAYSIGKSKRSGFSSKTQSPGPAEYMLPPTNTILNRSPAFHMGSKARPPLGPSSREPVAGPHASHLVKFDKFSPPRITFGIRHSPYKVLPGFAAEN